MYHCLHAGASGIGNMVIGRAWEYHFGIRIQAALECGFATMEFGRG